MIHRLTQFAEECFTFAAQLVQRHPQRTTALVTALLLGGTGATFAVANLVPDASDLPVRTLVENVQTLPVQAQTAAVEALALRLYRSDTTRSTDTAETLLKRLGVFDPQAAAFLRSDAQTQQVLLGRAGRNVTVETSESNALLSLSARWSPEDDGMFKRLTVESTPAGFRSRVETLPMMATSRLASGTIKSSLFAATDDARIPDTIATQLAEIFSGDIDFHRALRKGDRFSVVYETLEGDGEPMRAGRVLSAEFINAGKTHQAMWFQEPATTASSVASSTATHSLTKGGYYTLAGQSLHRAFLASPMEFSRITSGFKMRFHPILQTWRAHNGVDYAAPTGTPIRSVGEGVVDFAGVQGGYGNIVMVKHNNSDTTVYAHLSRINVKRGEHVSQGQHIGAVGSTGWATGPHLHFEFRINGVFRDPLTVASRNTTIPVSASAKPLFDKAASQVRSQLAAAAQTQLGTAQ
ncbi:MAG: M23 family metallopeptidase [Rhodoferax sp.]|nr:M23 family metallopeptidase [Rhodoferax sp.]MDP3653217.1 M23 family metallopeptidase [Rhodoferax sp.]